MQPPERNLTDAGDAIGNRVATGYAPRVFDERGLALVEQDPIHTAIGGIARPNRDCRQAGAAIERPPPDAGDVVGDRHAGQAGAPIERRVPDACDVGADYDAGQAAVEERSETDVGDAVGDRVGSSGFAFRILNERGLGLVEQDPSQTAIVGVV